MPDTDQMPQASSSRGQIFVISAALVALVWAVFGQTLRHGFLNYDDDTYVYANPEITGGLRASAIQWTFTHPHSDNWHPLTSMSHMLDVQLFGLAAGGHHLTNVLLHSLAVVLLFFALRQMTGALWRSAFVAAVFAIHPLRVESVAWIAERKDVLSGVFFMLTISAYIAFARGRSWLLYLAVLVCFSLGLMSKPTVVTLPAVLLLLDYWPLGRLRRVADLGRLLIEKVPLFAVSALACAATMWAQRETIAPTDQLPVTIRVANAFLSCVTYLWQMVWPVDLAVYYPHPGEHLALWKGAVAGVAVLSLTLGAWFLRRRSPSVITGWLWYLGMLVPVIGIIQVGSQAHADRYTYLPQIGIYFGATWAIADLANSSALQRRLLAIFASVAVACLAWRAFLQTNYWRTPESLWLRTAAVTAPNEVAHNGLGHVFLNHDRLQDAITEFETALRIRPDYSLAAENLGLAYLKVGRVDEAIAVLRQVVAASENDATGQLYLADALLKKTWVTEAIEHYRAAVRLKPEVAAAHMNLGSALLQEGEVNQAIAEFEKTLSLDPNSAEAEYNLGNSYFANGNFDEAIAHYSKAEQIRPDYAEATNNIGLALINKGEVKEAIAHWRRAVADHPDFADAQNNIAWVLATSPDASLRDGAAAVGLAEHARELSGDKDTKVLRTLAAAYAEAGRFEEAIAAADRASELAREQNDFALLDTLEADGELYRSRSPLRDATQSRQ